jgi:Ca-activated chloride channel family protein
MVTYELSQPTWLFLLSVLPLWWWWVRPRRTWGLMIARATEAEGLALRRWLGAAVEAAPYVLRGAAVACLALALAQPQRVRTYQEPVTEGVGIVLAVDLSTSMWAEDMADRATRLDVAKETLQRFLETRIDDIGLVSFAGEALTRLPLTDDGYVTRAAVEALEVGLLIDGTDVAGAIAAGGALLRDSPHATKVLILVTDGAHNRAGLLPALATRAAAAHGVRIYSVAIGTDEAAGAGSANMATVLTQAALITGGRYFHATDAAALDEIYTEIDRLTEPSEELVDRVEITPAGVWPLLAAMVLLLFGVGIRGSRWGVIP